MAALDTFRVIIRTEAERNDQRVSWERPDEIFFAAGACHILAGTALAAYNLPGFKPLMIQPHPGFFGTHVVVANADWIFDWRGWNSAGAFLAGLSPIVSRAFS